MPNTAMLSSTWTACWSWLSPPGLLSARNGRPSRSTIVGDRVVRGRLPPWTRLGCGSSLSTNACMRLPSGTPVSPAMNVPPKNQPDDGAAEKRLPFPSAASMLVVSDEVLDAPAATGRARPTLHPADASRLPVFCDDAPLGALPGSSFHGSPGRIELSALVGSMSDRRRAA